ncbi:MAG TPA: serine/threonine-protein kinase [Gemmataceae bacterium]|jgi:tRNA A-37 threonylcarbamoyl transferase component Bud32|nr:serine/threonine-protein kinase [Gemmataceae bacterium]
MATSDAAGVSQLARRLDLVTDEQLMDAWAEVGTRTGPAEPLLRVLEKKGHITPFQASKLLKGDKDGYILGGYRILYRIAAGSFGRVYRGDNPRTGEVVAIKVLRKRWAEDSRKIELFEREGKVGLSMQHPNIVRILAVNRDPTTGQYYLVMEFVEGGNLRDFLQIRKKLEAPEALRLLEETASGLAYALELGLTHRDLKPTNILISSTKTAKLVDFGLAELAGGAREEGGEIDRTVDYAGLEKATGAKAGDLRSDIYFLGTTFHEMVTGRPLLTAVKDARARMQRQRFEIDGQLQRDDPDLPPPVFSLLSRMVAFDPNGRFQTYQQLIDAIHQVRSEVEGGGKAKAAAGPKTVFVVEQNSKFQDAFRAKLKASGYRVLISLNAGQALMRFQQQPYHALIVDCATGDRSGLEAFEKVLNEADLKRMDCAGLLLLSKEQAHWADTLHQFPKSAALVMPVGMKEILKKLKDLAPLGESAKGATDE